MLKWAVSGSAGNSRAGSRLDFNDSGSESNISLKSYCPSSTETIEINNNGSNNCKQQPKQQHSASNGVCQKLESNGRSRSKQKEQLTIQLYPGQPKKCTESPTNCVSTKFINLTISDDLSKGDSSAFQDMNLLDSSMDSGNSEGSHGNSSSCSSSHYSNSGGDVTPTGVSSVLAWKSTFADGVGPVGSGLPPRSPRHHNPLQAAYDTLGPRVGGRHQQTDHHLKADTQSMDNFIMVDDSDFPDKPRFACVRGSDPLLKTARGKLQARRSKLNDQINRELRLRAGAENLFKATGNRKLRDTVALELSFVNSNLQLLKEELADLNSSVDIYQGSGSAMCVPMIPLGLKDTKEVDFRPTFRVYLKEHYYQEPEQFETELAALHNMRQACRTPQRNEDGLQLLYQYYNHLYFMEKRFFPPHQSVGVFFEWYDSLTGVPSCQRTVGFEKGSILFNIAAIYTQIAARQDRSKAVGIEQALEHFQRAAGAFCYIHDHFSHAPSMDMQHETLTVLQDLMLAQTQECLLEKEILGGVPDGVLHHVNTARHAAMVAHLYGELKLKMNCAPVQDYIPPPWVSMVEVKGHFYRALAHYHAAIAVLDQPDSGDAKLLRLHFDDLHKIQPPSVRKENKSVIFTKAPASIEDRQTYTKAHLRQSVLAHEDALRMHGRSKQLRKVDTFQDIIKHSHDRSLQKFSDLEDEDDFTELVTAPDIKPKCEAVAHNIEPDFMIYCVDDLFHGLGPIPIFCASTKWSMPKRVEMQRGMDEEYGFSVRGGCPVIVAAVEDSSLAHKCGMKVGDFIVSVSEVDIKWRPHETVVQLIREAGCRISLELVTPLDRNYLAPTATDPGTPQTKMQGPSTLERKQKGKGKISIGSAWTLKKRRSRSREKDPSLILKESDSSSNTRQ